MKTKLIALASAAALALGTLAVYAHEPAGDRGGRGGHRGFMMHGGGAKAFEHLTKDLDLTPQQQAQVGPIVDQAKPQIKAIHEEAMQKAKAVMENAGAQIRPLLTAQQQQKFDSIKQAQEDMMNAKRDLHQAKEQ